MNILIIQNLTSQNYYYCSNNIFLSSNQKKIYLILIRYMQLQPKQFISKLFNSTYKYLYRNRIKLTIYLIFFILLRLLYSRFLEHNFFNNSYNTLSASIW